ncbi:MAG: hypothetical protein CVU61_01960 [Deltaproteobacteria bacterium HGW-Deltaproteobacteria-19]|jgi:hypothetical protein|nr:MAG: hypothetical protein CVU61_01960 [Deltaproteobacteria bacterium HGW-Deltaproteobacteria-19]
MGNIRVNDQFQSDKEIEAAKMEIMDLTKIASTFPQIEKPSINRETIIMTLADMLSNDTEVVIVNGPDGIGKTTLLSQFAREFPNNSFSLFVRSCSRYAYDSVMLMRDLCNQIGWVLKKGTYGGGIDVDLGQLFNGRLYDLQKQANLERQTYYFIVDGLEEIPEEDCHERDMILNLLPFGIPRFRFILSGPLESLNKRSQKINGIVPFILIGFTFEETRAYFEGLVDDRSQLEFIHKMCKRQPGNLASMRRLLQSGKSLDDLLEEFPKSPPEWFELEWRVVENDDHVLRQALAILAFDRRYHSIESLSRLCKTDPVELEKRLARCSFVERRNEGHSIEYVCDVFKRFAMNRLSTIRRDVLDLVISELLVTPESADALTNLPSVLHEAGRYDELLNYLSPMHIGRLIDCGDSWVPLHQKAELGVETALSLSRDGDLLRFGLQRAMIASIENAEPWRSEIEAYVALDDFSAAQALVQRMVTKEDRLQLLAVITKAKKMKSIPIEIELNDQIHQLYRMIDRKSLGDRGIEIASDLLYTHPELAIELVQECAGKERSEDRLDLALAKLSVNAFVKRQEHLENMMSTQEALSAKVKDPKIQKFINTISIFFGEYTAEGIVNDVNKWEKSADRIYALTAWAAVNAERPDSAIVLEHALNTILKATTYTANAKVYKDLALPLVHMPDLGQVKVFIGRFDGLKGPIESAGPTVEYVALQGTLAEAEARYDKNAAADRLLDLFIYLDSLADPGTKLEAFAILACALKIIDQDKMFEGSHGIHSATLDGLKTVVDEILMTTADHYKAVRPAIAALTRSDKIIALEVINRLNTLTSRESALVRFMSAAAAEHPSEYNFSMLAKAYNRIRTIPKRAKATHAVIRGLLSQNKNMSVFITNLTDLAPWVMDIPDAEEKCQAICELYEILIEHKNTISTSILETLLKELEIVWAKIDSGWARVNTGFKIVAIMAKCSPDVSRDFLAKTIKERNEIILDCKDTAMSYIFCIYLTIRCFSGLIKRKLYKEEDFQVLEELINNIPSIGVHAAIWSNLALKCLIANDKDRCLKIVSDHVRPISDSDLIGDEETRWRVITSVAPTLYSCHPGSTRQLLNKLPMPYKDEAYYDICSFLINNEVPSEIYDYANKSSNRIDYDIFIDVYEAMMNCEADDIVYHTLKSLVDNIYKRLRKEFSKIQITDILQKLKTLIDIKLPNPDYIKHEGYKILAEAQIARLERDKNSWDNFISRARLIPNIADRAFVLMAIADIMQKPEKASTLFKEARALITKMSSFEDRYNHYKHLADICAYTDKQLSKDCLQQAWNETTPMDLADLPKYRRRIIDLAHRIDPEFAASLASESDDDPGREFARRQAKERIELLKQREQVSSGDKETLKSEQDNEHCKELAKMMLAGLNSNRINPVHIELTRPYINQASRMNLQDAFDVFAWVIENAVRRYSDTEHVNTFLRPLHEASRLSAELAFRIAARIRSINDSGISATRHTELSITNVIHTGEREKALTLLKEFALKSSGFIKITDPYFGLDELEIVKLIRSQNSTVPIYIVTSRKHQQDAHVPQPWDDAYQSHWRMAISDSDPGEVTLIMVGRGSLGQHPIHDRWWLSENGGVRIGTSLNSIGCGRISEVSPISETDAHALMVEVDQCISGQIVTRIGENIRHSSFRL